MQQNPPLTGRQIGPGGATEALRPPLWISVSVSGPFSAPGAQQPLIGVCEHKARAEQQVESRPVLTAISAATKYISRAVQNDCVEED